MRRSLAWALLLCAHVAAADPRSAGIRVHSFPHGPTVLLAPDSLAGSAHLGVWYEAGSRNDPRGAAGLAYVQDRGALAPAADARRVLESAGAAFDRAVTPDVSSISVSLPSEQLGGAIDMLAATVAAPAINDAALRDAIAGARAEREWRLAQSPMLAGIEQVCATLFQGHGYALPPSGTDEQLAAIGPEVARQDLATRFAPAKALITITGRFDTDAVLRRLQARFGEPGPAAEPAKRPIAEFGSIAPRVNAGEAALPLSVVMAGWRLPPDRDPDAPALEVLSRLLAGGANPLAGRDLVADKGTFVQVQGNFERRADACMMVLAAAVEGMIDTAQVEAKLADEVERWGKQPVTAADLEPAQRSVEAELLLRAQSPDGRAEGLATAQIVDGDWRAWEQRLARVRALTPADIQRAAARSLLPSRRTMVWMAPAPAPANDGGQR
jgi:zinc protease